MHIFVPLATALLSAALAMPALAPGDATPAATTTMGSNYAMSATGPAAVKVGGAAKVLVTVKPADGWHMNLDFPASLALTSSDGLTLGNAKLKKGDAKQLDASGLVFEVAVNAKAAGPQTVEGTLKFAVCRDEACSPSKEQIAVKINVE